MSTMRHPALGAVVRPSLPASPFDVQYNARAGQRWCPEEDCSIFSKLLFLFPNGLMQLGAQKALEDTDLWDLSRHSEAAGVHARYAAQLEATSSSKYPHGSVWTGLVRAFGPGWATAGLIKLVHDCVNLASPWVLRQLLHAKKHANEDRLQGLGWALVLFCTGVTVPILVNQYFLRVFNVTLYVKASLIQALYEKCLRISIPAKNALGGGSISNLQSNDAAKLWMLPNYGHVLWSGPFQVGLIIFLLHRIVGWGPALAGLATTVMLVPLNTIVGRVVYRYRKDLIAKTDKRVKLVTEIINGVRAIKLYAWEEPYMERLRAARRAERLAIRKVQLIGCINSVTFMGGPILVAIAAFWTFTAQGNTITADIAFPALAYFDLLRFPIIMLPMQVMNFINARVAVKRLQSFMNAEEVPHVPLFAAATQPSETAIAIENGTFTWDSAAEPILRGIDLQVPATRLIVVVGPVGCGKSSLLSAILHEMAAKTGSVKVRGRVAYTAQDPWIQNNTVEGNILMGAPMNSARYAKVIEACALRSDLDMLPAGDQTEIGEKGVNLSGGQKHRIALARACYADADVYLLDDPLSAVDAHVGRHIMSQCVRGLLRATTRVLVTHQVQFLPEADLVVVMEGGRIKQQGTYQELVGKGVAFKQIAAEAEAAGDAEDAGSARESLDAPAVAPNGKGAANGNAPATIKANGAVGGDAPSKVLTAKEKKKAGALTGKEERAKGSVGRKVYMTYLRAWGPGLVMPLIFISLAFTERGFQVTQNFWLSIWSEKTTEFERQVETGAAQEGEFPSVRYMLVYFSFGITSLTFQAVRAVVLVFATLHASQVLHDRLVAKLMALPMAFFDTQPTGRLINRFTKDVEACDIAMQQTFSSFTMCITSVLLSVVVIIGVTRGAVLVALAPLAYVYSVVQRYYLATSRELKRLDSIAVSPIFSNFAETLAGLATVRAFGRQPAFARRNEGLMDGSNRAWWPIQIVNRWLSIRLEFMGQGMVLGTAVFVTLLIDDAGLAGLAITAALNLVSLMNWATRQATELEMNMNSVERLTEYLVYDSEAPAIIPGNRPSLAWPTSGAIHVTDLVVRYRPDLPAVLKGISFKIGAREKVGICGRTGCGKSTLMLALYRIVEPSSGSIKIDGIEATSIGLYDLRSRLSLVPQDPVIFMGTVRSNLVPFGEVPDCELWQALTQAGLADTVRGFEMKLDAPLEEGGSNLSVGQRQLLCMARALLKRSTVLFMDEATSNVDNETDALIQSTVRSAFADCTVLTIAHRLHTIIDSDKILMLNKGEILEYAPPGELLKRPGSAFRALVKEAGGGDSGGALSASKSAAELAQRLMRDDTAAEGEGESPLVDAA